MLTVDTTAYGDTFLLRCNGRVVLGTGSQVLREKTTAALQDGAKNIVLDMGNVNYIDSSGIGELVSAYTTTRNSGGELVLTGLQKKVRDLLSITKLITVFQVFETADAALENFHAEAVPGESDEPKV
jgi:anti-sigma B factor antagonist